ncbi:MAG: FtsX-like permease family protein [Gammaproteobacteria bacterium]|nr:FtsX-like permease family protein [Gammaproteobacteria bacterium]
MIARWSWQALRRDWRAGELRLIALALIIAVAASTAVGFFTDRIGRTLSTQTGELIGGDLVLVSSKPIGKDIKQQVKALGLISADTLTFRSAVSSGDDLQLAELKAVAAPYPLRGRLRTSDKLFGEEYETGDVPTRDSAWLDARLMQSLGLETGDTVNIGAKTLEVSRVLTYEPDRGGELFNIAPRAMINLADIPATDLIQPGSRVKYHLLLGGEAEAIDRMRTWLRNNAADDLRVEDVREGRPELRTALDRAEQFLGLAAIVAVALAGLAVALATRRYTARHLDHCAIMRCFGATQNFILAAYTLQLLWLGLIAGLIGIALGWFAQHGLVILMSALIDGPLPAAGPLPAFTGLAIGLVTLLGFALPQIYSLKNVPPGRVLRRDLGPTPAGAITVYGVAVIAIAALLPWQSGDPKLSFYILLGLFGTAALLAGSAWLLIRLLGRLRARVGVAWRFGLANVSRRAAGSAAQVLGIGLGLTLMLLLTLVRTDLLDGWRDRVPADAPNYFLINVQPDEARDVAGFLRERAGVNTDLYPMVRGRLIEINGEAISPEDYPEGRPRRLVEREFNLSWTATMQADNKLVAGDWWPQNSDGNWFSVEEGIAETLGIDTGDTLTYQIGDQTVTARVRNLRWVEWDSFNVNFFVVANPGVLDDYPATYITSFYLPSEHRPALNDLIRQFPSATVLDVDTLLTQVRRIMEQVILTVEYVFGFTLLAGLVVLLAAIQSTHDERRYETALLTAVGASRAQILRGLAAEFTVIGLVAGTLSGIAATLSGWLLANHVFNIPYEFNPLIWLFGLGGGVLVVLIAGLAGTWKVLRHPPLAVLR